MKKIIIHKARSKRYKVKRWKQKHKVRTYGMGLKLGKDMPPQLIIHRPKNKNIEQLHDITLSPTPDHLDKPIKALWTSSKIDTPEGPTSEWGEWVERNQPGWYTEHANEITLNPDAKVFEIDNKEDIEFLYKKYPREVDVKYPELKPVFEFMKPIDWQKVAKDYDAVRATDRAVNQLHLKTSRYDWDGPDLYSWDAESMAILNKDAIADIKPIKIKPLDKTKDYNYQPEDEE